MDLDFKTPGLDSGIVVFVGTVNEISAVQTL